MLQETKAIVLSAIKFQDSSLIVRCYTQLGIKSYILKGILKAKKSNLKTAYFQPFTLLEIHSNYNNKGHLNYIKNAHVYFPFHSLNTDIYKSTIVMFLSEILNSVLKEEETNLPLFNYLETALIWLDKNEKTSNFHLLFLLKLTKHLGFYPKTNMEGANFFNLTEGVFSKYKPLDYSIQDDNLTVLKSLIGINFDALINIKINTTVRQSFLMFLIEYFALHLPEFKKPKSLSILHAVFS